MDDEQNAVALEDAELDEIAGGDGLGATTFSVQCRQCGANVCLGTGLALPEAMRIKNAHVRTHPGHQAEEVPEH